LEQVKKHKLEDRLQILADKASAPISVFTKDDALALNIIDDQLTSFMLAGKKNKLENMDNINFGLQFKRR
jgi:hypothetical protein